MTGGKAAPTIHRVYGIRVNRAQFGRSVGSNRAGGKGEGELVQCARESFRAFASSFCNITAPRASRESPPLSSGVCILLTCDLLQHDEYETHGRGKGGKGRFSSFGAGIDSTFVEINVKGIVRFRLIDRVNERTREWVHRRIYIYL